MPERLPVIPIIELVDAGVVALMLWAALVWLRRTRARLALVGLVMVGGLYLATRRLNLALTAWLLQGFFVVSVIVLVLVFQEDLRRLFERIAAAGLRRKPTLPPPGSVEILVRTATRLADSRTGALIVLPGRESLDHHLEGGIAVDARLSEPLLLSLFDPHSPGHDGAILVAGDRVVCFAAHLPLSNETDQLTGRGTRHAAALGLAERTDALCIVMSEERGDISIARDGRLQQLPDAQALAGALRAFLAPLAPPEEARPLVRAALGRWREALAAVVLAAGLWMLFVPGSAVIELERTAPVLVENLPAGYELEAIEPEKVQITLSGRRRDLYFADPGGLTVRIDALLVQLGRRTFQVTPDEVEHPESLRVVAVEPKHVKILVRRQDAAEETSADSS